MQFRGTRLVVNGIALQVSLRFVLRHMIEPGDDRARRPGSAYQATRQSSKAEDAFMRSLDLGEQRWGPSHPNLTVVLNNLGSFYIGISRFKDAEDQFRRSLMILKDSAEASQQYSIMMVLYGLGTA